MVRRPAVADRFYPGDAARLRATIENLVPPIEEERKLPALAVVMPHAGYVYSGATAGRTIARVRVPERVILLGPNHHGRGAAVALGTDDWAMPMGMVPIDQELASLVLARCPAVAVDQSAHLAEHSLEVQVPFLQYLRGDVRIVPLVVSSLSYPDCKEIGQGLAAAIRDCGRPVLLLASTDMSHYESRQQASQKDGLAIERIQSLDPKGLYDTVTGRHISMCGIMPTTIALAASIELGATRVELVRYTDSGEMTGDSSQVVGYAGLVIS